jgi:hypothetical protein
MPFFTTTSWTTAGFGQQSQVRSIGAVQEEAKGAAASRVARPVTVVAFKRNNRQFRLISRTRRSNHAVASAARTRTNDSRIPRTAESGWIVPASELERLGSG